MSVNMNANKGIQSSANGVKKAGKSKKSGSTAATPNFFKSGKPNKTENNFFQANKLTKSAPPNTNIKLGKGGNTLGVG